MEDGNHPVAPMVSVSDRNLTRVQQSQSAVEGRQPGRVTDGLPVDQGRENRLESCRVGCRFAGVKVFSRVLLFLEMSDPYDS